MDAEEVAEREEEIRRYLAAVPAASWYWRVPVVRHVRAAWYTIQLNRHYAFWESLGSFAFYAYLDYAVRDAIWRGEK